MTARERTQAIIAAVITVFAIAAIDCFLSYVIWGPIEGAQDVSLSDAGIFAIPAAAALLILAPLCKTRTARYGARRAATIGGAVSASFLIIVAMIGHFSSP